MPAISCSSSLFKSVIFRWRDDICGVANVRLVFAQATRDSHDRPLRVCARRHDISD